MQHQLPWLQMVAVGGTAAAIHCGHRYSTVVDCVTALLRDNFDLVEQSLEEWPGWKTNRVQRPVLILGENHAGVELGIRQQRRAEPLRVEQIDGMWVPTIAEALRIKAFLATERQATRDYIDVVALADKIGDVDTQRSLSFLNLLYPDKGNQTRITNFAEVMQVAPVDLDLVSLGDYKGIKPPYSNWNYVQKRCSQIGKEILVREMEEELPEETGPSMA